MVSGGLADGDPEKRGHLQRTLGLDSYRTAWTLLHATFRPGREPLGGHVKVDETFIGGEEDADQGWGRYTENKHNVMVGVEFEPGTDTMRRARMARVPDFSADSFLGFILENVRPGSTFHTDGHQSYRRVASLVKRWWLGTHQGGHVREAPGSVPLGARLPFQPARRLLPRPLVLPASRRRRADLTRHLR